MPDRHRSIEFEQSAPAARGRGRLAGSLLAALGGSLAWLTCLVAAAGDVGEVATDSSTVPIVPFREFDRGDPATPVVTAGPIFADERAIAEKGPVFPDMSVGEPAMPADTAAGQPVRQASHTVEIVEEVRSALVADEAHDSGRIIVENAAEAAEPLPAPIRDVSAEAAEAMQLDESWLDEMPVPLSSGAWFGSGYWYASGESLWLERSRQYRVKVSEDLANVDLQYFSAVKPFGVAPGARATIGRSLGRDYLNRDRYFEFTYYGGMTYEATDGWNSLVPNSLVSPLGPLVPGFNGADSQDNSLNSDFNSYEWNFKLRRRLGRDQAVLLPNGDWAKHAERGFLPAIMVGVRLASIDEDFSYTSRRNGVDPSLFGGDYVVNTENWLLGMNFGGELISQNEFFYWGLRGRGAPCLAFNSNNQTAVGVNVVDPDFVEGTVNRGSSATQTGPGFIGDLSLLAGWNITPNFSLKAGYEFLWVAGIATATRQFNLDNRRDNPIDGGGQIFYQGLSFGFEGSW
jgi:hypothetical protein